MRIATLSLSLLLCFATSAVARRVPSLTYQELMEESDLVVIVHAKNTRPPRKGEGIASLEYVSTSMGGRLKSHPVDSAELDRFTAVFTEFQVLAVVKGQHDSDTLEICHYKFKSSQQLQNGPSFVVFPSGNSTIVRGKTWSGVVANDFMLFLKYDTERRLTFLTGQYDPEYSVKQITPLLFQNLGRR